MTLSPVHIDEQWKKPLILSLTVHFLSFILTLAAPFLFDNSRELPEVYTVDLFNVEEIIQPRETPPTPPVEKPVQEPPPPPSPPVVEETVSVAPTSVEPLPEKIIEAPASPISLKPRKAIKNLRGIREQRQREDLLKARALEKIRAQQEAARARVEAATATRDAVDVLRQTLKPAVVRPSTSAPVSLPRSGSTGADIDAVLKAYYADLSVRINGNWSLPDIQNLQKDLEAIYVIHVNKNGIVTDSYFEKRSENLIFNNAVEKTIQKSLPLPRFPEGLNKNSLEIGLRFRPGGMY